MRETPQIRPIVNARRARAWPALVLVAFLALLGAFGSAAAPAGASQLTSLAGLRTVDYFPSEGGWGSMWTKWDPAQMDADFARIASLHANGVRIIVNVSAFGFPRPKAVMISRLAQSISLAAGHGLRAEVTMFDGWSSYSEIAQSKLWASEVLAPLRGSGEISYIDLHNELPANTSPAALAWAQAMVPYVQSIDDGIPVTISSSISSGTAPLQALVSGLASSPPDLYDVHYFGNAADAFPVLAKAKDLTGSVPLLVGETGFATDSTYGWARGLQPDALSLEAFQDYYFRMVENATRSLGLGAAAPWILYDMPGQGNTEWGHHVGIFHANGTPKPAAVTLAEVFAGGAVGSTFNNSFEQSSGRPSMPTIWRRWLPREAEFSDDENVAHGGHRSARIEHARGHHATGCPALFAAPITAIQPGATYSASAWARGRNATGRSRVVLAWTDAGGRFVASSNSPSLPRGSSRWQELKVSARPPGGASAVEINLQVCENRGATWFDDVSFRQSR